MKSSWTKLNPISVLIFKSCYGKQKKKSFKCFLSELLMGGRWGGRRSCSNCDVIGHYRQSGESKFCRESLPATNG